MGNYMKKIALITLLLLASTQVMAEGREGRGGYGGYRGGYHGGGMGWVAPLAIGGLIGYELFRPSPQIVYQQAPQIVYQQAPQVVYQQPSQMYVYPVNVPVPAGMHCELQSNNINGQIVTSNYCFY